MPRKDYVAMAAALKQALQARKIAASSYTNERLIGNVGGFEDAINVIANVFAADNPRFDRVKFLDACECRGETA